VSIEIELLKRVRDTLLELKETHYDLYWDIQAALDLREGLSDEELKNLYDKHAFAMDKKEYMWGFRDAEKVYGIGGGE
jgi:hypothetical protein